MGISNRVLYLEPDSSVADRASAALGDVAPSIELVRVSTAAEVRRHLRADWDCLVVEWNLPGEDARELVAEVRERRPELPVVVFTEAGPESVVLDAYDAGATDYVRKGESGEGQYLVFARRVRSAVESASEAESSVDIPDALADVRSDAIVTVDEGGIVRFANRGVETVFGYAPEELVGEPLSRVISTESVEVSESRLADQPAFTGAHASIRGRRRDGTEVLLEASFGESSRNGERFVIAILRDVSGRRYEQALTALHESMRQLLQAEGKPRVAEVTVDTATEMLEFPYVCVYFFARSDAVLMPAAWSEELESTAGAPSSVHNGDNSPVWDAFVRGESVSPTDWFEDADSGVEGALIPLGDHGVLAVGSPRAEPFQPGRRKLVDLLASAAESVLDRAERATRLRKREREAQRQNERLRRLDRINDLIRRVDQALVAAETREEIEETVCELLVQSEHVEFAWFGSVGSEGDLVPRAWAGENAGYLDAVRDGSVAPSDAERAEPSLVAAQSRNSAVVENVGSDLGAGDWRREALSRGYTSVFSVPLLYDDYRYGALTMYADCPDAFDDLSRAVFEELGRTIAYAINAVETKRGFLANRVVELELQIYEDEDPLQRLAAATETTIEFEGTVPGPDPDASVVYFTTDATADALSRLAENVVSVRGLRFVAGEGGGLFQATVTGPLLATRIVSGGGVPRSIVVERDSIQAVVDLPHTADVRSFVESLEAGPAEVDLLARGERERPVHTRRGFRTEFESSLTTRQQEVLRTAYLAGYFESPRRSTGQEVGEALGISQPTVAHHLRIGLRKLLSLLYEEGVEMDSI